MNENIRVARFFWDIFSDIPRDILCDILRDILRDNQNQH